MSSQEENIGPAATIEFFKSRIVLQQCLSAKLQVQAATASDPPQFTQARFYALVKQICVWPSLDMTHIVNHYRKGLLALNVLTIVEGVDARFRTAGTVIALPASSILK